MDGQTKKIDINNFISLCYIINDFKKFDKNIKDLLALKTKKVFQIYDLGKISNNECVEPKLLKSFYLQNKEVIDIINKYSTINSFIYYNYEDSCKNAGYDIMFFYEYLIKHINKLDQILNLLNEIKRLGFNTLEIDENIDLSKEEYSIYNKFENNKKIIYSENIEVIPNYESHIVKYKTKNSNYKIEVETLYDNISDYNKSILVTNLLFDYKLLPYAITKEIIFDYIINLKKIHNKECVKLKNAIDLSIGVDNFKEHYNTIEKVIKEMNMVDKKEEIKNILLEIKTNLELLDSISIEYNHEISKNDSIITREIIEKEKQLYLKATKKSN